MAKYQNGGRNVAVPDENRQSWRPQDQDERHRARGNDDDHDYRGWRDRHFDRQERDPRRWEGSRGSEVGHRDDYGRSTEYYGQGQSGYSAGRFGDDRSQQMQNRNEMTSPGSFEDRHHDGWSDRRDRPYAGYESERYSTQGGYGRQSDQRNYDPRGFDRGRGQSGYGYDRGFSQNGYGGQGYDPRSSQHMGYQNSAAPRGETDWSPSQKFSHDGGGSGGEPFGRPEQHTHRGTGPHRGKGPMGYQRSDERIREMVSEALADDDMIDASQINVTVKDGEVTLSGVVDSRRIKREAEDCVSGVSGVRDVQIQLRVRDEQDRSMRTGTGHTGTQAASTSHLGNGLANGLGNAKTENEQEKKHRA